MKFEVPILTALLTYANDLFVRAAFQGIEQALLCAVLNSGMKRLKVAGRILSGVALILSAPVGGG